MNRIKFKEFVTLQRGYDLPKSEMVEGEFPVVGSTSIIGFHNEYKQNPPGVVTGRSGSLGTVQYITRKYWPHNTSLWVKDFKDNLPRYVYYLLRTLPLANYNAGAGVPTLNRNHLDNLDVNIHDLPDQRRVSSILSAYDDLIENNTRRIKVLEEMAQRIYQEWFVNFEFPVSPPDKGELEGVKYIPYNTKLKEYARQNRKNPTVAEKKMWEIFSRKQFGGLKFTRQKPLENFIVDFYCSELLLGIEIDGDTHAFQEKYDELRADILQKKYGIEIIRYQNSEVLSNTEGVYLDLAERVKSKKRTHPIPSLIREGI